jgi:hypothetical protein
MKLLAALVVCGLLLAGCASPPAAVSTTPALVGSWRSKVQFVDGPFAEVDDLEFLYSFNLGGTMTESSNYDGAPPVPPAYGAWRESGKNRFTAKYLYYNSKGPSNFQELTDRGGWIPDGYGELTETLTLSNDGKSFESEISLQMYDAAGKAVEGGGKAKGQATRIEP